MFARVWLLALVIGMGAAAAPEDRSERIRKERRERAELDREWRLKYDSNWRAYLEQKGASYKKWEWTHIRDRRAFDDWRAERGLKRLPFRLLHR